MTRTYLRLSVTGACALRCVYCLGAGGRAEAAAAPSLPFLVRAARLLARTGVTKVRVTGGEPLERPDFPALARALGEIGGVEWSVTTNGQRLARLAQGLAAAGFSRANVSVDSLRPEVFRRITGGGDLSLTLAGIRAARRAGLAPLKWNVVVLREENLEEVADFAALTLEHADDVRFIECMPAADGLPAWRRRFVPAAEVLAHVTERFPLRPEPREAGSSARHFRIPGAPGRVGFVAPHTAPFCGTCARLRLGADGVLRPCLCRGEGLDLRALLATAPEDGAAEARIREALASFSGTVRPDPHLAVPARPLALLGG